MVLRKNRGAAGAGPRQRSWPRRTGRLVAELIRGSHYSVEILACARSGQDFLSVFTEMVDWALGEDTMFWTVVPIEAAEGAVLAHSADVPRAADLEAMVGARRSADITNSIGDSRLGTCPFPCRRSTMPCTSGMRCFRTTYA